MPRSPLPRPPSSSSKIITRSESAGQRAQQFDNSRDGGVGGYDDDLSSSWIDRQSFMIRSPSRRRHGLLVGLCGRGQTIAKKLPGLTQRGADEGEQPFILESSPGNEHLDLEGCQRHLSCSRVRLDTLPVIWPPK